MMQAVPPVSPAAFAFPPGLGEATKTGPEGPAAFAFPPGVRVAMEIGIPQHLMQFEEIQQWAANPRPTSMPPLPFGLIARQQAKSTSKPTPSECEDHCFPDSKGHCNEGTKPPADSDDDGKATGAYLSTAATSSDDERENESWPSESCNEEMAPSRQGGDISEPLLGALRSNSGGPPERVSDEDINADLPVTTLVIRHLPSLSTQAQLMQLWQPQHPQMDFLFVPYSAKQHRCCRYAFVNFATAEAAQTFRECWAGKVLPGTPPGKAQPLSITTSRLQGLQANIDFYCKVGSHAKSRQPAIFSHDKRVNLKHLLQNRISTSR